MATETHLRVLIAFDDGQPTRRLIEQLPRLLGVEHLELSGLFVEDEELLRTAAIPGLREVSLTGSVSSLDAERLRERLALQAENVRAGFEALATGLRAAHSFEVISGHVVDELCRAAERCDFVVVTRSLRASGLRARRGAQFRQLARQPRSTLFVNEPWDSGSTLVVVPGRSRDTEVARRFAEAEGLQLVELPPGRWEEEEIAEACLRLDARLLVLPRQAGLDSAELLAHLIDRLPCSLLLLA